MGESQRTPRLDLDPKILQALAFDVPDVVGKIRDLIGLIRREPDRLVQTRHSSLAQKYRMAAVSLYAIGYPIADVRKALAGLALAGLRTVELRGTEEPFLKAEVILDPTRPPGDPQQAVVRPALSPDERDDSLGNARKNLLYTCAGLAAGEFELAGRIAAMAGDPPGARWVGPRSWVCTPNDQHVAYALKHLLAGDRDRVLAEIAKVRPSKYEADASGYNPDAIDHADLVKLIRALAVGELDLFIEGLQGLLDWHEQASLKDDAPLDVLLSVHGTGLTALALKRGWISRDIIPADNPFIPIELIDLALGRAGGTAIAGPPLLDVSC